MKPVNLLPAADRRKVVSARRVHNSSFVVIGLLGVLLLATLFYVSTQNKINGAKTDIAKAKQRTQEAEARSAALGPFAKFARVKEKRVNSVKTLATQRFDWERLMREIALVLPEGTALNKMSASTTGNASGGAGGGSSGSAPPATSTPPSSSSSGSGSGAPAANLLGCAKSQDDVATMMVRLRALHRVDDVTLTNSEKSDSGGAGASSTPASGSASSGSGGECPAKFYKFDVSVTFKPADTSAPDGGAKTVPSRLGGGE